MGQIWGLFRLFRSLWATFGVAVRLKNFFGTYLHRQSIFVLELPLYFWFLIWSHLGLFLPFLGALGLFFWVAVWFKNFFWAIFFGLWDFFRVQKHFWNLPMQAINFGLWSTVLSVCSYSPNLGPFLHFLGSSGLFFGVGVGFKNFFGTYLYRLTAFILEVSLYLASLKLSRGWLGGRVVGWVVN